MAIGWLNYVKAQALILGIIVIDRERYLVLPELDCIVRLSRVTGYPIFRFRDSDYTADIICYYSRRLGRYICRALPRIPPRVIIPEGEGERYEWQSVYSLIFEACYPKGRKDRGFNVKNNLHVECFKTYEFTSRDINRYIRRKRERGLKTLKYLLEYMNRIRTELEECCIRDCYEANFTNYVILINLASENYGYYSSTRRADICYMDRCEGKFPREFIFICEAEVE